MKTTLHARGNALTVEYRQNGDEYTVTVGDTALQTQILATHEGALTLVVDGQLLHAHVVSDGPRTLVALDGHVYEFARGEKKSSHSRQREAGRLSPEIRSPMPGKILDVRVTEEANVETGQVLVVLEAMKMENALTAEGPARVRKIHVAAGELVELGQLLVELEFPQAATQGD
ncbi:MAG: biotin/lipoyl-binding protein [Deltaproteobacteria bacterium]|nr:biotin/lipoyl-binding protein [Deltaproteobacteria bacterium]